MSFTREGDTVVVRLTQKQFDRLLIALGMATSVADCGLRQMVIRLVNEINEGNPNFTPYEVDPEPHS